MKVWNYVVIMLGLIIVLQIAGFDTGSTEIFGLVGLSFSDITGDITSVTLSASNFFDALFGNTGLLIGLGIGAIIAGLFTRAKPENLILLPLITGTLTLFIQASNAILTLIIGTGDAWLAAILVIFLLPFTLGFVLALAEFFRGTD